MSPEMLHGFVWSVAFVLALAALRRVWRGELDRRHPDRVSRRKARAVMNVAFSFL